MRIDELASLLPDARVIGDPATEITDIKSDSRLIEPGDLFICVPGTRADGHDFAAEAVARGAKAIVAERRVPVEAPMIAVKQARHAMAVMADHFFGYPSHEMKIIGITGTNGKTTTSFMLEKILSDYGIKTGLMGTIRMKIGDETFDVKNTTQESLELQRHFRRMRDCGTEVCVMEVSSHALAFGRVKGVRFRTAVFTNLTQDHLDFHGTMQTYKETKQKLFSRLGNTYYPDPERRQYAVLNGDEEASNDYMDATAAHVLTYGIERDADVKAVGLRTTGRGVGFEVRSIFGNTTVQLNLFGKFNVYNALAAMTAALLEGVPLEQVRKSLESIRGVDGRFEAVRENQPFLVIVDYAHTPDSLENVLKTIREFAKGNIYCVFGCGGDRDRLKRPLMGKIAARHSDFVIITSDNPRTENPAKIIEEIKAGLEEEKVAPERYLCIEDRRTAIEKAIQLAEADDVVLIAGKGHETYQEIMGVRHDFDDREIARAAIRRRSFDSTHHS